MEYSRLINDYLEGELHPVLEDNLFSELALNQDLRFELNKQIKIHMLIKSNMNSITIPSESTEAIFGNLGFSIPSASSNFGSSVFTRFTRSLTMRKSYKYFMGIATAILVAFMIYTNLGNDAANTTQIQSSYLPTFSVNSNDNSNSSNYPLSTNHSGIGNNKPSLPIKPVVSANNSFSAASEAFDNNQLVSNDNSTQELLSKELSAVNEMPNQQMNYPIENSYSGNSAFNSEKHTIALNSIMQNSIIQNQSLLRIPEFSHNSIGIEVSWSKQNFNINKPQNLPDDDKTFAFGSNFSILYKIDSYHSVGFDFGEETFPQEFIHFNGEQNTTIKQNPNYQWFVATYRYKASNLQLLDMITPFTKIMFGGARGGVLAKAQLGISWQLNSLLSANISGEYGSLLYNVNKNLYHSDKFGIMYGLTVHL